MLQPNCSGQLNPKGGASPSPTCRPAATEVKPPWRKMIKTKHELPDCPVAITVQILESKWKLLIVRNLLQRPWRFNELHRSPEAIRRKVLTSSLRSLEAEGIVRALSVEMYRPALNRPWHPWEKPPSRFSMSRAPGTNSTAPEFPDTLLPPRTTHNLLCPHRLRCFSSQRSPAEDRRCCSAGPWRNRQS